MKFKTLSSDIRVQGQNTYLRILFECVIGDVRKKLKLSIKTDNVVSQADARIEMFDGEKWNLLVKLLPNEMRTIQNLAYCRHILTEKDYEEDIVALKSLARLILT